MCRGLLDEEAAFRRQLQECAEILAPHLGFDLVRYLYPAESSGLQAEDSLSSTNITQPLLFAVEYSLARLLASWWISPQAMIGHSLGEYTAACVAGVLSLEDALRVVAIRGKLRQTVSPGLILAVPLPEEEIASM